jgi:hypothetical protein
MFDEVSQELEFTGREGYHLAISLDGGAAEVHTQGAELMNRAGIRDARPAQKGLNTRQ